MAFTWTPDHDRRLRDMVARDVPCVQIAAEFGCNASTVSRRAAAAGLSFDRTRTAQAVAARVVDLRARRVQALATELDLLELQQAKALDVLTGRSGYLTRRRGEGGAEEFVTASQLLPDDARQMASARASSAQTIKALHVDTDEGRAAAASLLSGLADAFGIGAQA